MSVTEPLSDREREILRLVATGASNKEIATQLYISSNTVKVHLRNIFAKTGVVSRTEATVYAIREGIVDMPAPPAKDPEQITTPIVSEPPVVHQNQPLNRWLYIAIAVAILIVGAMVAYGVVTLRQPAPIVSASPISPAALPRWQEKASVPTARTALAAAAYENQIYTIAGQTEQGIVSVVERYDPTKNAWTTLAPKPIGVKDAAAAVVGGKIYVPGGVTVAGIVTDTLDVYDPRQDRWEQKASLPKALSGYSMVAFEGKLYVFGGWDGQTAQPSVYEYDPPSDNWKVRIPMSVGRAYTGATVSGAKIYIIGGYDGTTAMTTNLEYTPDDDNGTENPWKERAALPYPRYGMGVSSVAGGIYVIGGISTGENRVTLLEYLPAQDKWQEFDSPLAVQWSNPGVIPMDTVIYVIGGSVSGTPTAQTWSFQAVYSVFMPSIR